MSRLLSPFGENHIYCTYTFSLNTKTLKNILKLPIPSLSVPCRYNPIDKWRDLVSQTKRPCREDSSPAYVDIRVQNGKGELQEILLYFVTSNMDTTCENMNGEPYQPRLYTGKLKVQ